MRVARCCVALAALALVWLAGCDSAPKKYKVSGTVKYKGEPVKSGLIQFRPDKGGQGTGGAIVDGKYEIPAEGGLEPGSYKVAINYPDPKAPQPKPGEPPGPEAVTPKEMLPKDYNDNTKLTAEIKPQNNEVNFDLK
jgi:hypothetical protein